MQLKTTCSAVHEVHSILIGTEFSLPCTQEPATDFCTKQDESNPHHVPLRSFLILSTRV